MFSDNENTDSLGQDNKEEHELEIFQSPNPEENFENNKEPEMFEKSDLEEDFEIPAFLRRQKN